MEDLLVEDREVLCLKTLKNGCCFIGKEYRCQKSSVNRNSDTLRQGG